MNNTSPIIEKRIRVSAEQAASLSSLAQAHHISEDQLIAKALDMLFSASELFNSNRIQENKMYDEVDLSFLPNDMRQRFWQKDEAVRKGIVQDIKLQQRLLQAGLLNEIRVPALLDPELLNRERTLLNVSDTPLSQVIIEERR